MVTTQRLIPVEALGSDPPELVRLTGSFQVLARVTLATGDELPAHVELCFDAARVRGVGLKKGARYEARGAYRLSDTMRELPVPLDRVAAFELLRHGPGEQNSGRLLLIVPFRVTVRTDGKVTVGMETPTLLLYPGVQAVPAAACRGTIDL
jgi:hypothetical protein